MVNFAHEFGIKCAVICLVLKPSYLGNKHIIYIILKNNNYVELKQILSSKVNYNKLAESASLIPFENATQFDSATLCIVLSHCRGRDSDSARCPISATIHIHLKLIYICVKIYND